MGLPDRLKNTFSGSNTPWTTDKHPDTAATKPAAASRTVARSTQGLPPFKPPQLPTGHRAVLVACAKTGKASWAVLKHDSKTWRFVRNLKAVPDPTAARSATTRQKPGIRPSQTPQTQGDTTEIAMEDADFGGFSCGVCGADGSQGSRLMQCGNCKTFQCQPAPTWNCPACGIKIGDQPMGTIESLSTNQGAPAPDSRSALGSSSDDPHATPAVENARSISAAQADGKKT